MELYDVVLWLHITVLLAAFFLTGAVHTAEWLTARAATVQEMRGVARPLAWGVGFGPVVGLMLLLGGWLVKLSDDRDPTYSFGDGWVWTGALALLVALGMGIGVEGPHATRLLGQLAEAPDGPPSPALREQATAAPVWAVSYGVPFMIVGVASNMVNKPSTGISVLVVAGAAALGALVGLLLRGAAVSGAPAGSSS